MKKRSAGATQVTFSLKSSEVIDAILDRLSDSGQIIGENTTYEFKKDGECKIVTMHYGIKSDIKEDEIKL